MLVITINAAHVQGGGLKRTYGGNEWVHNLYFYWATTTIR